LFALFVLALGFYVLLVVSLAAYAAAIYLLIRATPSLFEHPNFVTLRYGIPMLLGLYTALFVFSVAIVRGMFARADNLHVGIHAHRANHAALFTAIREVAELVGASPLDEIVLSPGCEVGVWEESK